MSVTGEQLQQVVQEVLKRDFDRLHRPEFGGRLAEMRPDLLWLRTTIQRLVSVNLNALPQGVRDGMLPPLKAIITVTQQLLDIKNGGDGAAFTSQYTALTGQLDNAIGDVFEKVGPVISQSYAMQDHMADFLRTAKTVDEDRSRAFEALQEKIEVEAAHAREILATKIIAHHSSLFAAEAKQHRWVARGWLVATMCATVVTACFAVRSYAEFASSLQAAAEASNADMFNRLQLAAAYRAVSKLVVLSILGSFTVWLSRLYRASKHNDVINQHRHIALASFEAFAIATEKDPAVKHAVLLQASGAIFAPQPTGYGDASTDSPAIQQAVLEVVRKG